MLRHDGVYGGLHHERATEDDGGDPRNIADIDQRIGLQHHQIGSLPNLNRTLRVFATQEPNGIDHGCLEGLPEEKPGPGEPLQPIVKAETSCSHGPRNHFFIREPNRPEAAGVDTRTFDYPMAAIRVD